MYNILRNLGRLLRTHPEVDLTDVFAQGQINSKEWLIKESSKIDLPLGKTFVLGGWYGTLPAMMLESGLFPDAIFRSIDVDPKCAIIADTLNRDPWVLDGWQFKASTADMFDLDYNAIKHITHRFDGSFVELTENPDTLINTSCEHIDLPKWWKMLPVGTLVILQSNDFKDGDGHINCVDSLEEFKKQAPMLETYYEGVLELEKYNRFMLIGLK